ncbi:MAG TPA: HD domain-containing phosphohydrolase [Thermodesulfovibrionales bacterium]|nr:HD domain-containing phosphohydrolase [Thermodesulfovibrionales bacterium]
MAGAGIKKTTAEDIRNKIRLLNLLNTFVILSFLFVVIRYVDSPFQKWLSFLPDMSIALILILVAVLAVIGLYLSRVLSGQIIHEIEDYSAKLDSVLTLTRDVREEMYGDILLNKILDCALAVTRSAAGSILLLDGEGLVYKIVKGFPSQELLGRDIPRDAGIAGWALKQGEPAIIGDAQKDERYNSDIDEFHGYAARSVLCVPLKTKSSPIGVIEIMSREQDFFMMRDLEMISYLSDQAALSIERSKFFDDQRNYEIHLTDILIDTLDRFISDREGHSKRVARFATVIATALNFSEERKRRLYFASLLHDIGFLRLGPEKNSQKESYTLHPVTGYDMLSPISFYKDIAPFILHHHERYDGLGYPGNLRGDKIPLESRIIAIAEAFDSMVDKVSYKASVAFDDALSELVKNRGGQFDPELVDLFIANVKPLD